MVCLKCDSYHHTTFYCDMAKTKTGNSVKHTCCDGKSNAENLPGEKYNNYENFIGWDSTEGHKLFCAERIKALKLLNFFLPKIDQNLLPRFLETMEIDEKYVLCCFCPSLSDVLKSIKIIDILCNENSNFELQTSNVYLVNNLMELKKSNFLAIDNMLDQNFSNAITSKTLICFPRILYLYKSSLSGEMLLQLLSKCTKKIRMEDSNCVPNISFTDIIKKAPNLQDIHIYDFDTNIIYEKTWMEDLIKYKNGKDFQFLNVKLDTLELDVKNLVEFVSTKCSKTVEINILFNQDLEDEDICEESWEIFDEIKNELEEYFDDYDSDEEGGFSMSFDGGDSDISASLSLQKIKASK